MLEDALIYTIFKEDKNGQKDIADTIEILRKMWCEIGEEDLKEWIQRTFVLVQSEEILLGEMCESCEDSEDTNEQVMVEGNSEKNYAEGIMCNMWSNGEIGDTSQRRKPNEQFSNELDLLMQKLSFKNAQTEVLMYCLRNACEGKKSVFETLSAISEGKDGYNGCISINHQGGNVEQFIPDKTGTLTSSMNSSGNNKLSVAYCYDIGDRRSVANESVDVCPTLLSKMGTGGNNVPVVIEGLDVYNQALTGDVAKSLTNKATDSDHIPCVVMDRKAYNQGVNAKFNIGIDENGIAFSHIAKGPGAVCYCLQGNQIDQADTSTCNGSGFKEGTSYTLNVRDRHAVVYNGADVYNLALTGDKVNTLTAGGNTSTGTSPKVVEVKDNQEPHYVVRRLTPLECERLQGFPDYWTDIGSYIDSKGKKKQTSDSARYKALGNSIALPSWKWIIKRLCSHYERDVTMESLFDGIGGFPHLWEQINGKGTCIWASEIEDFPVAVTKVRIG